MDSVTNTKYIPNSSDRTAQTSEPKLDARGGQFERQIELLNERKNHLKREIAVLDRQERSADRSKPCSQNRGSDQSGCRSSNERKKILNEEIGALNKEMKVLNEELKLINHSRPHDRGRLFHEKMKILNEEMQVLNKEMQVLNKEFKLVDHSKPHRPNHDNGHHGESSNEKIKILNQEIYTLNEKLSALNKELEVLNKRRIG